MCAKHAFHFFDNGAVTKCDLRKDGIYLLQNHKVIFVKTLLVVLVIF